MNKFGATWAAACLAACLLCAVFACGGGHHNSGGLIHYTSNIPDDDTADDDAAPGGSCADYAAEFFGASGCFPETDVYNSALALCAQLASSNNPYAAAFFQCLANIECAHYTDYVALWDAIDACLKQLP